MPAHHDGAARTGAGVRKPAGKEPARGVQRGRRGGYGDLAAAAGAAVMGSRCRRFCWWLSARAFELGAAPIAVGNGHDRGAECGGFGCRPIATVRQAPGPASESLQGRNPREVGSDGAAGAMGIWPRRLGWR